MNTCVLIPAYNEAETIGYIITSLKSKGFDVLVIDDGSSDDTGKIAADSGAILLRHQENLGKGASMREGFEFILKKTLYDAVIVMDGDGQHKVGDIDKFLSASEGKGNDIIIGNRMGYTKNMPLLRLIVNKFMSQLLSVICGQKVPDSQCGYRLIKRGVIDSISLSSSNYDTESEMLIKASRKGFKISSVPVMTIYRGERSDIHPVKDTFRFLLLIARSYIIKR